MISYYYLPEYSGAAKQMHCLIERLLTFGTRFTVISAQLNPSWPIEEVIGPCKILRVPIVPGGSPIRFWIGTGRLILKLRNKTDVVLLNGLKPDHGFSAWFANLLRIPAVGRLSIANSDIKFSGQGRVIGNLNRWFLSYLTRYIAISSMLRDELRRNDFLDQKCTTILNGVDTTLFKPASEERRCQCRKDLQLGDKPTILFVGVIDYRKGVDVLIKAISIIATQHPRLKVLLVGPRNREDASPGFYECIQKQVKQQRLESHVVFIPYTKDIHNFYHASDIFVLPSRQEGMANVILEAMACGLPVISTQISGTGDIITNTVEGFLVPPDNAGELALAMQRLLNEPKLRTVMGFAGAQKILELFDIDSTAKNYNSIFHEVSNRDRIRCNQPL